MLPNEMSGYQKNKSTSIFFGHALLLSCKPVKIRQNNMDHRVLGACEKGSKSACGMTIRVICRIFEEEKLKEMRGRAKTNRYTEREQRINFRRTKYPIGF